MKQWSFSPTLFLLWGNCGGLHVGFRERQSGPPSGRMGPGQGAGALPLSLTFFEGRILDIRRATREELQTVNKLLLSNDLAELPASPSLANVLLGLEEDSIVGVVALDVVARFGLTRWLVVAQEHRGQELGKSLVRGLVTRGQELGLRELYALPGGARKFLEGLGFREFNESALPREVRMLASYPSDDPQVDSTILRMSLETRV